MATMHSLFTQVLVQKNLSKVSPQTYFLITLVNSG